MIAELDRMKKLAAATSSNLLSVPAMYLPRIDSSRGEALAADRQSDWYQQIAAHGKIEPLPFPVG
jgi:hypothetical protein